MNRGAVSRRVNKSSAKAQWVHKLYEEVLEFLGCAQLQGSLISLQFLIIVVDTLIMSQSSFDSQFTQLYIPNSSSSFQIVKSIIFVITCAAFDTEILFSLILIFHAIPYRYVF